MSRDSIRLLALLLLLLAAWWAVMAYRGRSWMEPLPDEGKAPRMPVDVESGRVGFDRE